MDELSHGDRVRQRQMKELSKRGPVGGAAPAVVVATARASGVQEMYFILNKHFGSPGWLSQLGCPQLR